MIREEPQREQHSSALQQPLLVTSSGMQQLLPIATNLSSASQFFSFNQSPTQQVSTAVSGDVVLLKEYPTPLELCANISESVCNTASLPPIRFQQIVERELAKLVEYVRTQLSKLPVAPKKKRSKTRRGSHQTKRIRFDTNVPQNVREVWHKWCWDKAKTDCQVLNNFLETEIKLEIRKGVLPRDQAQGALQHIVLLIQSIRNNWDRYRSSTYWWVVSIIQTDIKEGKPIQTIYAKLNLMKKILKVLDDRSLSSQQICQEFCAKKKAQNQEKTEFQLAYSKVKQFLKFAQQPFRPEDRPAKKAKVALPANSALKLQLISLYENNGKLSNSIEPTSEILAGLGEALQNPSPSAYHIRTSKRPRSLKHQKELDSQSRTNKKPKLDTKKKESDRMLEQQEPINNRLEPVSQGLSNNPFKEEDSLLDLSRYFNTGLNRFDRQSNDAQEVDVYSSFRLHGNQEEWEILNVIDFI